jgi:hypothetical protein
MGVLTIPGCEIASLLLLSQVPERAEWFDDENVMLTASSEPLITNTYKALNATQLTHQNVTFSMGPSDPHLASQVTGGGQFSQNQSDRDGGLCVCVCV